MEEEKAQF